jgi:hypothetical protein
MNIRPVFLVLSFAFGVAVIGAAITTKNYVETRHAEGRQAVTAGWLNRDGAIYFALLASPRQRVFCVLAFAASSQQTNLRTGQAQNSNAARSSLSLRANASL